MRHDRREKLIELAARGSTEGERRAAIEALVATDERRPAPVEQPDAAPLTWDVMVVMGIVAIVVHAWWGWGVIGSAIVAVWAGATMRRWRSR